MTRNQKIIFCVILALAAFLIFFRLTRHDPLGDDAHYSFRAIGYVDYLGSNDQTTPVQWFGERPWWSYLSFHDHPPLVFLVQHVFFKFLGPSLFVSRLPAALASIGAVAVIFFIGRKMAGVRAGLFAALALAVNSYFIWTGRQALLEGVFIFFMLLALLYLLKGLEDSKYFFHSGLLFGLTMLSKYTLLPIIAAVVLYLLIWQRPVFRDKRFWYGVAIFVGVCSPIIIYNLMMYKTRGHFDVQFADLFGQVHRDWVRLQPRISRPKLNFLGVLQTAITGLSWPYFGVFAASLGLGVIFGRTRRQLYLVILPVVFLFLFFTLVGGAARWMGVLAPFAALTVAVAWDRAMQYQRLPLAVLGLTLAAASIFYTFNTNHARTPLGNQYWFADFRTENYGYNELDQEISRMLSGRTPTRLIKTATKAWWYGDLQDEEIGFLRQDRPGDEWRSIIIIDSQTIWFPIFWIAEKWKFYHGFPIMTTNEFLEVATDEHREILNQLGFDGAYYVRAGERVRQTADIKYAGTDPFFEAVKRTKEEPKVIRDGLGREAFYLYKLTRLDL